MPTQYHRTKILIKALSSYFLAYRTTSLFLGQIGIDTKANVKQPITLLAFS